MEFSNRIKDLNLNKLWWNDNRRNVRDSLVKHFKNGGGPAHLTGKKGAGKTTMSMLLSKDLSADIIRMRRWKEDMDNDFNSSSIIIVDEAQMVSLEDRKEIIKRNKHVLMTSVQDLSDDGIYEECYRIKSLTRDEIKDYIRYQNSLALFTEEAIDELKLASKGQLRLLNLLCSEALKDIEVVDKKDIRFVATKRFKLRYGFE